MGESSKDSEPCEVCCAVDDEGDEMEPEVEEESVSTSKGRRKLGVRIPGTTLVPQDRLDNILQAEGKSGMHPMRGIVQRMVDS